MQQLHNRRYYRVVRAKHIKRKKNISSYYCADSPWYPYDGMYSKGKIHCSCGMCSLKTRNKGHRRTKRSNYFKSINWKHSDLCRIEEMNDQLKEYGLIL